MPELSQQELTELEKSKISLLKERIKKLPAYPRRKKDEKNRQVFSLIFLFAALTGIMIFGSGWLAVAIIGTILSLVIVEFCLFLSIALGFSDKPLYNTYLWLCDVFVSQKIKNQNKEFDQMDNQLLELERLAAIKSSLMTRINYQLNYVLQWLLSNFFTEENTEFEQGPIFASNVGRMTYLLIRDLFSSTVIKAENEQLTQLEKAIDKLVDLENQLKHIVKEILSKLEPVDVSMQSDEVNKEKEGFSKDSKINHSENKGSFKYGAMFPEVPVNQMVNTPLSMPSLTS